MGSWFSQERALYKTILADDGTGRRDLTLALHSCVLNVLDYMIVRARTNCSGTHQRRLHVRVRLVGQRPHALLALLP